MSVYCPNCGCENRDGAKFCRQCRAALTGNLVPDSRPSSQPLPGDGYIGNAPIGEQNIRPATAVNTPPPWFGDSMPGATGLLPANTIIASRYVIMRKVGQGGMAAVYEAMDTRLNRRVALKEMSDAAIADPAERAQAVAQFHQEAELLGRLEHPNLPKVSDVFDFGGKQYLVMDFVDGETLQKILDRTPGPLPEAHVATWAVQLCDVLNYLHSQNPPIIFRDLKPSNIMIDRSGQVKLIDFGIARSFKPGKRSDTMALGTPGYAAPEQHGSGQSDARTDIYALGVTLHHLLTRHDPNTTPWGLPPVRQLNPSISPAMVNVITRALESNREKRWQSTGEIRQAITGQLGVRPPVWPPQGQPGPLVTEGTPLKPTSRPTTRLVMMVAQWSTPQIVLTLAGFLVVFSLGLWLLTPALAAWGWLWNALPGFVVVLPLAYCATRKSWAMHTAYALTVLVSTVITNVRMGWSWQDWALSLVLLALLLSGLIAEGAVRLLPRIRKLGRDEEWPRELAWIAAMTMVIAVLFEVIFRSLTMLLNPVTWIGGAVLGALGWFAGDLVWQSLQTRQGGPARRRGDRKG